MSEHPESRWTHPMCQACWNERYPDREAHRLVEAETETCCWCGSLTRSGVYVREDPATTPAHSDWMPA